MHEERNERAGAALGALERYRREADADGTAAGCLLEGVRRLEADRLGRRRAELVGRAVREGGLEWSDAEQVYAVSEEEGLDPAFAFQLVRCGVGVRWPGDAPLAATTLDAEVPPEWVAPPATTPPPESARREWRLRASFRRLRRLLEERKTPEDALLAFVDEPDVDASGY